MPRPLIFWTALAAFLLAGCGSAPDRESAIGEAYAGPATLKLRSEIDPKSKVVATLHHGVRLEILAQRRRWYKVRAKNGAEGWTDDRELLDTGQMDRLRALAKETAGLPSQVPRRRSTRSTSTRSPIAIPPVSCRLRKAKNSM
jgi:SH3-like domain-containing protein